MTKDRNRGKASKPGVPSVRTRRRSGSTLSRYISFVMLLITILVFGFFFFSVIRGFLLPLFLATLLAVIFRPFHHWVQSRVSSPTFSAALATAGIMLIVLIPLAGLISLGVYEANQLIRNRKVLAAGVIDKAEGTRRSFGLQKPFASSLDGIETELRQLETAIREANVEDDVFLRKLLNASCEIMTGHLKTLKKDGLAAVREVCAQDFNEAETRFARFDSRQQPERDELATRQRSLVEQLKLAPEAEDLLEKLQGVTAQLGKLDAARMEELAKQEDADAAKLAAAAEILRLQLMQDSTLNESNPVQKQVAEQMSHSANQPVKQRVASNQSEPEKRAIRYVLSRKVEVGDPGFVELIDAFEQSMSAVSGAGSGSNSVRHSILEKHEDFTDARLVYDGLRTALLGGPIWASGIEAVNPSSAQVNEWMTKIFSGGATRWLPSITNTATSLLSGLLMGLAIMSIALFYFFLDGSKMINAMMHLSPLDDQHELELLQEFDKVSRAVVLATLLAAVVQGILGAIGYRIVGLDSIFLLSMLTMVLALIPFVGAAAIWLPCCFYLAFIREPALADEGSRMWLYMKAGFLFVYGAGVISMADNIIKPWVLQGQSKLHPLLALLSVLGGVQALGPIGILVGPMVVAFLQVLLTILQREITVMDEEMNAADA